MHLNKWQDFFYTMALIAGVALGFAIPTSNAMSNVWVVILLLAWCFSGISYRLQLIWQHKITWVILLFVAVYLLGLFYTAVELKDSLFMLRKMSRLILIPIIMSLFTEAKWRKWALFSFWLAIIINILFAVMKVVGKINVFPEFIQILLPNKEYNVAFVDRIITSLFVSFTVFSWLHYNSYILMTKTRDYFPASNYWYQRYSIKNLLLVLLALVGFSYIFMYCDGRSGQIILIGLIILYFLQNNYSLRKFIIYSMVLITSIGVLYKLQINQNINERYQTTYLEILDYFHKADNKAENTNKLVSTPLANQCTGLRLEFLTNSLRIISTSPIIGYGTGSFRYIYNKQFPLWDNGQQLMIHNPHNQYILVAVELGLIGLLALLLMFVVILVKTYSLPSLEKHLAQGVIFSVMLGCLVNSWLMDFATMHYFVYFLGICFAATAKQAKVMTG